LNLESIQIQTQPQNKTFQILTLVKHALVDVAFRNFAYFIFDLPTVDLIAVSGNSLLHGRIRTLTDAISAELGVYGEIPQQLQHIVAVRFLDVDIDRDVYQIDSCEVEATLYRVSAIEVSNKDEDGSRMKIVAEKVPSASVVLKVERRDAVVNIEDIIDIMDLEILLRYFIHRAIILFGISNDTFTVSYVACSKKDHFWPLGILETILCNDIYGASLVARLG